MKAFLYSLSTNFITNKYLSIITSVQDKIEHIESPPKSQDNALRFRYFLNQASDAKIA